MRRLEIADPTCTACQADVLPTGVLVYADSSGLDGPATDPYHLACYLDVADCHLPSNYGLDQFVASRFRAVLECVDGHARPSR